MPTCCRCVETSRNSTAAITAWRNSGHSEVSRKPCTKHGNGTAPRHRCVPGHQHFGIHSTELAYRRRHERSGALPADFHYGATHNTYSVAWFVQSYLGLRGPSLVVSTACSSSAKVFGTAARTIAAGLCDAAVVGGVDSLCLTTLYGFGSLGLLSAGYCRPFDSGRDGISIGEGAGFILLEKPAANSAANTVALLGFGESSDAYHMSSPHPEGLGARLAMESALRDAGLAPGAIDYINLHGTGTPANDAMEDKAVVDLSAGHCAVPPRLDGIPLGMRRDRGDHLGAGN